jgi:hypothetical protein
MLKVILIALLVTSRSLVAGDLTGTVRAEPKAGLENTAGGGGAYESKKYKFIPRVDYAAMRDFVVYLVGSVGTNNVAPTNIVSVTTSRVAQKSATFSPHILPVVAGTTVEWPNNDEIYHNVFSISDAKEFDLGLYQGNPPDKRVTFNKAGKVDVFCSIHANMHCVVLVLENPYFATTDASGHFSITNIPPGKYKVRAWHERLPADEQEIVVPETGTTNVNFVLTIKNLPAN